jgi:hypothetical protein
MCAVSPFQAAQQAAQAAAAAAAAAAITPSVVAAVRSALGAAGYDPENVSRLLRRDGSGLRADVGPLRLAQVVAVLAAAGLSSALIRAFVRPLGGVSPAMAEAIKTALGRSPNFLSREASRRLRDAWDGPELRTDLGGSPGLDAGTGSTPLPEGPGQNCSPNTHCSLMREPTVLRLARAEPAMLAEIAASLAATGFGEEIIRTLLGGEPRLGPGAGAPTPTSEANTGSGAAARGLPTPTRKSQGGSGALGGGLGEAGAILRKSAAGAALEGPLFQAARMSTNGAAGPSSVPPPAPPAAAAAVAAATAARGIGPAYGAPGSVAFGPYASVAAIQAATATHGSGLMAAAAAAAGGGLSLGPAAPASALPAHLSASKLAEMRTVISGCSDACSLAGGASAAELQASASTASAAATAPDVTPSVSAATLASSSVGPGAAPFASTTAPSTQPSAAALGLEASEVRWGRRGGSRGSSGAVCRLQRALADTRAMWPWSGLHTRRPLACRL